MPRFVRFAACAVTIAFVATVSCAGPSPATGAPPSTSPSSRAAPGGEIESPPVLYEAQQRVDAYIDSGRYEADVARVATQAQMWLEENVAGVAKPAIVLDIDETSLSNWPAYKLNGWGRVVGGGCDLQQGPCGLRAWQALGQSKALTPTLSLTRRARELGVALFFISGRPSNLLEATERNLREQGYQWDGVIVEPEGARFESAVQFKAPERKKLSERGYTILLSIGDQDSDLAGGYAKRTFKYPNPVYFLP